MENIEIKLLYQVLFITLQLHHNASFITKVMFKCNTNLLIIIVGVRERVKYKNFKNYSAITKWKKKKKNSWPNTFFNYRKVDKIVINYQIFQELRKTLGILICLKVLHY